MPDEHRTVRSYVRRAGRLTSAQSRALENLWPIYGIEHGDRVVDLQSCFGRHAQTVLDIGFGNGESLIELARQNPGQNFLGIEVHEPGVGHLLLKLETEGLSNVRIVKHDAVEVLAQMIASSAVDRINLFFPDPWPKKRHHKRRIVQSDFVSCVADRLVEGGVFHMATDWQNYAEHMRVTTDACEDLEHQASEVSGAAPTTLRPTTKFEARGLRLGHRVWDLLYRRVSPPGRSI